MMNEQQAIERRVIPLNVALSTLSLLLLGVSLMFYDVRIGFAVIGGLAWFDLFLSSLLEQLSELRLAGDVRKRARGVKRDDRTR